MKKIIAFSLFSLMLATSPYATANSQSEVDVLKAQVQQLTQTLEKMNHKLNQLEKNQTKAAQTPSQKSAWTEQVKIKGDLRYRYENIHDGAVGKRERERHRIRARLGIFAHVNDTVDVGLQLATGGEGNPTSTNETLDSSFGTKDFDLDLAYFDWHPVDGIRLLGGKMKNPFFRPHKTALLWDGDLRPEGLAVKYNGDLLFANAGAFYIEEDSDDQTEAFLFGGQIGLKTKIHGAKLTTGVGYFHFEGLENKNVVANKGNTLKNGAFENDYEEAEAFFQLDTKLGTLPLSLFGDFVNNTAAKNDNQGYLLGVKVGKTKKPGSWDLTYIYEDLEADAVVSTFTDGDFADGGTNGKGHIFKAGYAVAKNWTLGMTYFKTENGKAGNASDFDDYDRLQADIKFKF